MKNKEAALSGINSLLQNTTEVEAPKKKRAEKVPSIRKGLSGNDVRVTYILNDDLAKRVAALCYWLRVNRKDVVQSALIEYIEKYERLFNKELLDEKRKPFKYSLEALRGEVEDVLANLDRQSNE